MGKYINTNSKGLPLPPNKVAGLIEDGAVRVDGQEFIDNLVCVVDNGPFMAAAYCDTPREHSACIFPDGRKKVWLQYEHASKVAR